MKKRENINDTDIYELKKEEAVSVSEAASFVFQRSLESDEYKAAKLK
ncbi:hypothetical protein NLX67_01355 [Domibacillus sp. A3M-37]|nr:hypothetical protein [Domibacillus sp. A3M-37]MCP3761041.1 hypothetical protein [Domibacillus sp. A3M-37]